MAVTSWLFHSPILFIRYFRGTLPLITIMFCDLNSLFISAINLYAFALLTSSISATSAALTYLLSSISFSSFHLYYITIFMFFYIICIYFYFLLVYTRLTNTFPICIAFHFFIFSYKIYV